MNKKLLLITLLLTPVVVWNLFNAKAIALEWVRFPSYIKNNLNNVFSGQALEKVEETRWNAFSPKRDDLLSELYYNKGYVLIDNFFSFLTFLSPRFYFLAGDGTRFSPQGVEPVAGILFPFWVLGVLQLIKKREFKLIYLSLFFAFIAFLAGQKTFAFLLPVAICYLLISLRFLQRYKIGIAIFIMYSLYILGRLIWLVKF